MNLGFPGQNDLNRTITANRSWDEHGAGHATMQNYVRRFGETRSGVLLLCNPPRLFHIFRAGVYFSVYTVLLAVTIL